MNPKNIGCLTAGGVDCCVLANNHVLDWGYPGLAETLHTLHSAGIQTSGAGPDQRQAGAPAILTLPSHRNRVIVFSYATSSSGVPTQWAARKSKPGVNFLADLSDQSISQISASVEAVKNTGDIVLISLHWGGNWGYDIPREHIRFAHALVDFAGVDIVHGHSSHHPLAMEVYKNKPILYGCGDLLNDYEDIGGYESFRGDLSLLYFVNIMLPIGVLQNLDMAPMQIKRFRLNHTTANDAAWLTRVLDQESSRFNCHVTMAEHNILKLRW